jgi:hypothetical protein
MQSIVYLDQKDWIAVARVANGLDNSPAVKDTLDFMRGARDMKLACFPLSLAHYMETRRASPGAAHRLAAVMREISGGQTLAGMDVILQHELDTVLARRFPQRVHVRPLQLLGDGVFHAANYPEMRYTVPDGVPIDRNKKRAFEDRANRLMQDAMLSGVNPLTGDVAPRVDHSGPSKDFQAHLDGLHERFAGHDPDTQERAHYATSLVDILEPFKEALNRHMILWGEIELLGFDELIAMLEEMPTRRVDVHLHRQWSKNKTLRSKPGDLNDWGYVGEAAMYCDVVVTEKFLADMLKRDRFQTRARVITDLADLPRVVLELAA